LVALTQCCKLVSFLHLIVVVVVAAVAVMVAAAAALVDTAATG